MKAFNWQSKLQETVGKTVTGFSDSAARFKGWTERPGTSEDGSRQQALSQHGSSPRSTASFSNNQDTQYLRLPVDSLKKLRWYDRDDLSTLVELSTREKQQLQDTITALRQARHYHRISRCAQGSVIAGLGTTEEELEVDLQERLADAEHMHASDEALNGALLVSARAEITQLRTSGSSSAAQAAAAGEMASLRERLEAQEREAEGLRDSLRQRDARLREQSETIADLQERLLSVEAAEAPGTPTAEAKRPQTSPRAEATSDVAGAAAVLAASASEDPARPPAVSPPRQPQAAAATPPEPLDLPQAEAQNGPVAPEPLQEPAAASSSGKGAEEVEENGAATDTRALPNGVADHAAALQLQSDLERQAHLAQVGRLEGRLTELEAQAAAAEERCAALEAELQQARQGAEEARTASEKHVQELRAKVTAAQASQAEMLARAQDICAEAEERGATAQRRADRAEERASKAEADLKAKERERERGAPDDAWLATARRAADEREAELRRAMRDGEAKLRERISRLDEDNQDLRRSLVRARADAEALEARAHAAEAVEAGLQSELRAAEAAGAEADAALARCQALEERLSELRAEQGQLATYKEMAAAAEEDRGRLEAEVVATAQLATAVEARLRSALTAKDAAESRVAAAELRAHQACDCPLPASGNAEATIEAEVTKRLELSGADFARWPRAAREETARLEKKLDAAQRMTATLHAELDASGRQRQSEAVRLSAAEERATRAEWERRESVTGLERQLAAARAEMLDWRRELAAAEAERDRLAADKKLLTQRGSSGNLYAGFNGTPKARGGGSLRGIADTFSETPTNGQRDQLPGVDILYLKNVLLKFLDSAAAGRTEQCDALLPAIATLVRASPQEYRELKAALHAARQSASWWPS
ncbi:hypothetical protein COCSUDRAFT_49368 [Coccomyxa subellipsoidea C-169]|uniref:GRIP domain-containing protein n=1 Tax=Coccomyxa subellipsoidea (strain C-169) TaxID=574566 RepID=I0YIC4_COCSC|nr:hypothetical protein COCSUDRAFT_49368 [Coccomyxa subellipsoidea C-169]EIE18143.1 hypothetical protein COCSUDRAFT_49368 [Coccomyxa subellipsoidea C-169]|eukprot:XP_005642687.1 hypothetical protein COCSUDRAFT_49368 [Coccomyxa subellipsoidea C-169]